MIFFLDRFYQGHLVLTKRCSFKCLECSLWSTEFRVDRTVLGQILDGSFFLKIANIKLIHIVGADPMEYPDIVEIVRHISVQGKKVCLWTTPVLDKKLWLSLKPFVDHFMVYLPSIDSEELLLQSGSFSKEELLDTGFFLRSESFAYSFYHVIRFSTVSALPELYEFAQQHSAKLLLHYFKRDFFTSEQEAYIRRFYRVKDVEVYVSTIKNSNLVCSQIPLEAIANRFQIVKNACFELFK